MRVEIWIAAKYLFRNRKRYISFISSVAYLGVALGVSCLIIVLGVMNGFDKSLKDKLLGANFHIIAYTDASQTADLNRVTGIEGVKSAVFFAQLQTAVTTDEVKKNMRISPVIFEGLDLNAKEAEVWRKYLKAGDMKKLCIGRVLANSLNVRLGDTLKVFNPRDLKKPVEFEISGVFSFGIYDLDANFIVYPLDEASDFLKDTEALFAVGIRVDDIYQVDTIRNRLIIEDIEGLTYFRTWVELNQTLFDALKLEKFAMFVILCFIILVASFNIFATQTIMVVEKVKDIGILKTVGMSKSGVNLLFCLQGVFLGAVGVALGGLLGLSVCYLLDQYHFIKLPSKIYSIDYLPVAIDYGDIAIVCLVALAMSFIFSLAPSIRASRIKETRALRYE